MKLSLKEYQKRYRQRQVKYLERKAAKLDLQPCAVRCLELAEMPFNVSSPAQAVSEKNSEKRL